MTGPNKFKKEYREIPVTGDGEVLVNMEYVGICGSDVHLFQTGKQGENIAEDPMILGHEAAGVIAEVGKNVRKLKKGDKVALEPGVVCGICNYCKTGLYNLCPNIIFMSTPPYDGTFQEYVTIAADMAFKLPENVTTKEGALIEPLAVGLQATTRGKVGLGHTVLIIGAGCIGLMNLLACKARGAAQIFIADVLQKRLDFAKQFGVTAAINVKDIDLEKYISDQTDGEGVDVVIDCSGTKAGLQITPMVVKPGGNIVLVGMPPEDFVELNITKLIWKEINIMASFRYRNRYPTAIKVLESGLMDVNRMITHEFNLEELEEAFKYVIDNNADVVKAIVKI